jgi:hypothetical protein
MTKAEDDVSNGRPLSVLRVGDETHTNELPKDGQLITFPD